jgi:hypothetical protein
VSGVVWTVPFWRDAAERAIATAAQTAASLTGVGAIAAPDLLAVAWPYVASVTGGAALLSLLKSIAASRLAGMPGTASLVDGHREPHVEPPSRGRHAAR